MAIIINNYYYSTMRGNFMNFPTPLCLQLFVLSIVNIIKRKKPSDASSIKSYFSQRSKQGTVLVSIDSKSCIF